jgi:hypothetical protein
MTSNKRIANVFNFKPKNGSPNFGLILIDEKLDLDSPFGSTNGLPITFNELTKDFILKFSEDNRKGLEKL